MQWGDSPRGMDGTSRGCQDSLSQSQWHRRKFSLSILACHWQRLRLLERSKDNRLVLRQGILYVKMYACNFSKKIIKLTIICNHTISLCCTIFFITLADKRWKKVKQKSTFQWISDNQVWVWRGRVETQDMPFAVRSQCDKCSRSFSRRKFGRCSQGWIFQWHPPDRPHEEGTHGRSIQKIPRQQIGCYLRRPNSHLAEKL